MINKAGFLASPIFVLILLVLLSQISDADQAGFDLPQANGCYLVGTRTDVLIDAHRSRDLLVTMWYPAVGGNVHTCTLHGQEDRGCSGRGVEIATGFPASRGHARQTLGTDR